MLRVFCSCVMATGFLLAIPNNSWAGDGGGGLQLDPAIITNPGVKAGSSSDFSVKSKLFLPDIEQYVHHEKEASGVKKDLVHLLDFNKKKINTLFRNDYSVKLNKLFINYSPQVIQTDKSQQRKDDRAIYIALGSSGIVLTICAVWVGKKNAIRKLKKRGR